MLALPIFDARAALLAKNLAPSGLFVLLAASIVSAVLGSVHAFSVFITPLEGMFGASRSEVSLTYSFALIALTFSVLGGPRLFARVTPVVFMPTVCALAAGGAIAAGQAGALWQVWLGYSLVFGAANGLGYGYGLQIAARANPGREGIAMGVVTAAYALGSVLSPPAFEIAVDTGGFSAAMNGLAGILVLVGVVSAVLLRFARAKTIANVNQSGVGFAPAQEQFLLWLGYLGGVLAGLMVIGHAAGIASTIQPNIAVWLAPVTISVCNLVGSLIGGRLIDKAPLWVSLSTLPLMTVAGVIALVFFGSMAGLLTALGLIGFAYGGTIAAYPAAIARLYGMANSARVYGRVFTAWGLAGLIGPWLAGWLYDWNSNYEIALYVAAVSGLISVLAAVLLTKKRAP
ncbi:MAG: MFS transporter [Pikeienuella sp.]